MRVITEKKLTRIMDSFNGLSGEITVSKQYIIEQLINELEELDTLTPKETDLILAADN